ncbi:hypothetical protein [Actinacidiphila sp. ITFR-21]|uniref:hypothetical protein n=1 Tax=Actinacidiphila sp. ITFR-21 TaxID=3075199 RepID=UPI0028890C32|nr:hypothetical protein [Streptomyces sp. ITFR-21]WNI17582.1 hypothetical protein RLT57_20040 [Streptomyces sp. ITFR-21]WNI17722.1 hypothetical protein RLT57_20755 [Streptomyces sp. ITFR-21]
MWPLLAGMLGRAALSVGAREAAGTAVTAAARSGAISAGTRSAGSGSRVLSAMQFGSSAAHAMQGGGGNSGPASAPGPADDMGWARS